MWRSRKGKIMIQYMSKIKFTIVMKNKPGRNRSILISSQRSITIYWNTITDYRRWEQWRIVSFNLNSNRSLLILNFDSRDRLMSAGCWWERTGAVMANQRTTVDIETMKTPSWRGTPTLLGRTGWIMIWRIQNWVYHRTDRLGWTEMQCYLPWQMTTTSMMPMAMIIASASIQIMHWMVKQLSLIEKHPSWKTRG